MKPVLLLLLTAALGPAQEPNNTIRETIVTQERAELDALKTGDMAAFANLLADDAVFVDDHGPAGKAEVLKHTANFRLHRYTMRDVRFIGLSAEAGLLVYHLDESGISHGKEFSAQVYVSALWVKRGGKWFCVSGQETAAK